MLDPFDTENRALVKRLRRLRRLAWFVLFWERASNAFWKPMTWAGFFAALWLFGLPLYLNTASNIVLLLLFLGGFGHFFLSGLKEFSWPTRTDTDKRLEADSGLQHHPLIQLHDTLANPEKSNTRSLWLYARETSLATLKKLRPSWPKTNIARNDPAALRIMVLVLLIAGLFIAGPQAPERLGKGLFPYMPSFIEKPAEGVTLWITPPQYTNLSVLTLQGQGTYEEGINIPEGSIIKARVANGIGQPTLYMGEEKVPLERIGDKSWRMEETAVQMDSLAIKQMFLTRLNTPVRYIADQPPEIALTGDPEIPPKGTIQVPLTVTDDYSVTDLIMRMELDPPEQSMPFGTPIEKTRAIMSPPATPQDIKPVYDLTWHPWAGMSVTLSFTVKDHKGQTTTLDPVKVVLPERSFYHPVASALIGMRYELLWHTEASREDVVEGLFTLLSRPGDYGHDRTVFLSLRSMISRLMYSPPTRANTIAIIEQLWDTALRIEDGNLTMAARELRDAREKLESLLQDPEATDTQIAQAMAELQQAMQNYFMELYKEMQNRMAEGGQMPMVSPEAMQHTLRPEDFQAFMDKLQSESLGGDRDTARQMLSQLQQMMDMLDPSRSMAMPPQMQFMQEGVSELQQLIDQQQSLLDQTRQQAEKQKRAANQEYPDSLPLDNSIFKNWDGDMPPAPQDNPAKEEQPKPEINTAENQVEQDALRYILGELMLKADEQMGEIPQPMQEAEQEMRKAGEQLGENNPEGAIKHQEKALEKLQQAMNQMQQEMMQMMQQMMAMPFGMGPMDPLGRPLDDENGQSLLPYSQIEIPDEAERKRVHEILKFLRERSGEFHRPEYELEYYRRLMQQF